MKKVLAFDYGASSGRAILFCYDGKKITSEELHRFENVPVKKDGTLFWDFDFLLQQIFVGLEKAAAIGFDAIGIDTWGVDFGLIGEDGKLLSTPVHYRDSRNDKMPEEVFKVIPQTELYEKTGIQMQQFNTVFQLFYVKNYQPELYEKAKKLLLLPDLMAYELTGVMRAERTIASTTQLLDAKTKDWSDEVISKLGFKRSLFPDIIESGECYGTIKEELAQKLRIKPVPVVAVCCHDTASAIFSVPSGGNPCYLSCGTWSLLGTISNEPVINELSRLANLTNETGFNRSTRLLKNIMGLWIINECRREWRKQRPDLSFSQIVDEANKVIGNEFVIDVDDDAFLKPDNMPERIQAYCKQKYGKAPDGIGEIAKCVYSSLCIRYCEAIDVIASATHSTYDTLYVVGGGAKAEYLCKMIANVCKIHVCAGPVEATAVGNALVQLHAMGVLPDGDERIALIKNSFDIKEY